MEWRRAQHPASLRRNAPRASRRPTLGPKPMNWKNRPVVVTGGASFIGSHLVEGLVDRGAPVRLVDDLSSGSLENIREHLTAGRVEFSRGDLKEPGVARKALDGTSVVFHLAADHGGRGYATRITPSSP